MDIAMHPNRITLGRERLPSVEVLSGDVIDDEHAIEVFLSSYARKSPHTVRSYRKECLRFLLWLRATHGNVPALLPRVTVEDVNNYLAFAANPRPFAEAFLRAHGWDHQPFRKPLTEASMAHVITVLHKLFAALRDIRTVNDAPYCLFNPVRLAHQGARGARSDEEVEQALTPEEWQAVLEVIEGLPRETELQRRHYHRTRWLFQLLYRAFLRRDEAARLRMGDFEATADGWTIRLIGKGRKKARIVATARLIDELRIYRESLGLPPLPTRGEDRPAILAIKSTEKGITAQAIYLICKTIFGLAAERLECSNPAASARLRHATPHWMRHTGITHAMESGINPRYVQAQARHSSLTITARYDHKSRRAWRADLERVM